MTEAHETLPELLTPWFLMGTAMLAFFGATIGAFWAMRRAWLRAEHKLDAVNVAAAFATAELRNGKDPTAEDYKTIREEFTEFRAEVRARFESGTRRFDALEEQIKAHIGEHS